VNPAPADARFRAVGYRIRVMITIMLVVTALTAIAIVLAEHALTQRVEEQLRQSFQSEMANLHRSQELRQAALLERVRTLVRRARIHAAIEDDALDLLYPSAKDELRDVMDLGRDSESGPRAGHSLRARFYRFLDRNGKLIPALTASGAGTLTTADAFRLELPQPPAYSVQIGYIDRHEADGSTSLAEVIAAPIVSFEHGDVIAALVLGFDASALAVRTPGEELRRGLWFGDRLHMESISTEQRSALAATIRQALRAGMFPENGLRQTFAGEAHLVLVRQLNAGSLYPPAHDVYVYPLSALAAQKSRVRWQVIGVGFLLLAAGLTTSHFLSRRLTLPVERLADDSAQNRVGREKAEAALKSTHEELQRAARFSADASHQLKTPVAVLRAGLEELRLNSELAPETVDEISALIHQTYRLSGVIEDLLLLSRMDAGRLKLNFRPVDISLVIDAALDDLGVQPEVASLTIESNYPRSLAVSGDRKYIALILQNLLDNARKYNRPKGRISVSAHQESDAIRVRIGNTGPAISGEGQSHIFERFHRAAIGENIPGYGLGLNLARELARLHHGDLRLLQSSEDWTMFEVCFQAEHPSATSTRPA